MDAQLVLQVTDLDALVPLRQEQAQPAAVADLGFAPGQRQQDFPAAVGDEPLHPAQPPIAVVVLKGTQPDGLQVAAGIRLGQHHRTSDLSAREARQVFVLDLFAGKGMDCLGDTLQAEDVHQRPVTPTDDLGRHRVNQARAIQAPVPARQRKAHQVGLCQPPQVVAHQRVQRNGPIPVELVAFAVDLLGPGGDDVPRQVADDLHDPGVVVERVGHVRGSVVDPAARVREIVFVDTSDLRQVQMVEEKLNVFVIGKEVRHGRLQPPLPGREGDRGRVFHRSRPPSHAIRKTTSSRSRSTTFLCP